MASGATWAERGPALVHPSKPTDSSDTTAIPGLAFMAILLVAGAWRDAIRRLRLYAACWTRPVPLMRFRRTVAGHPATRVRTPAPTAHRTRTCRDAGTGTARAQLDPATTRTNPK